MIDYSIVIPTLNAGGVIVTIENHNVINGLGSAVSEVLSENAPCLLKRLGSKDQFGEVGSLPYLKETFKMSESDIENAVRELIDKK